MIQDATGKFSSRSPLPDRNSLAEVIEGWSTIVWTGKGFFARASPCRRCRRGPHIGEYGRKTNPVSRWLPFADQVRKGGPKGRLFVGQAELTGYGSSGPGRRPERSWPGSP